MTKFRPTSLSPEALKAWDEAETNIEASMQRIKKLTEDIQQPNGDFLKNYPEVTRVEVITNNGHEFVRYDCDNVQVSLQDDGRTIKVFLKQEQISEEENERRLRECLGWLDNLKPGELTELMGEDFMEEFRRVSQ